MRPVIFPLIASLVVGPAFIEPPAPELTGATMINRMIKALGDYATGLPAMPLQIERWAEQDRADASPPSEPVTTDVAIEIVCRALTEAAEANNLPVGFFARLIWTESRFKQRAVSHAGARGVAQFMPATAVEHGLDDPFDPVQALPASARFLSKLRDQFGNLGLAAAAYNAGGGRVQNWLARRKTLPTETRNYVRSITGHAAENWIEDDKDINLEHKLPRAAPCDGEAGLSTSSKPLLMKVALSRVAGEIVRKAEIAAARKAKREAEQRVLAALSKKKAKATQLASSKAQKLAAQARKAARTRVAAAA